MASNNNATLLYFMLISCRSCTWLDYWKLQSKLSNIEYIYSFRPIISSKVKLCVGMSIQLGIYVTGFWKISPNVTFYYSNIYNQNKEWELPINLKVVTICSSHLELPENNWKYIEKFCISFAVVMVNCVILCISMWH